MHPHHPHGNQPHQQPGHQPPPPPGYPPQPYPAQQHIVTRAGLPGWMHALYAIGGFFTCGLLWLIWPIHWWFAQSRATTTVVTPPPPPAPPYQYPPR